MSLTRAFVRPVALLTLLICATQRLLIPRSAPRRIANTTMTENPTGPAPQLVQTAAGAIECAVAGDGVPVLAVHGGMGGHDQSWLLARALLPDISRHRVLAVSRPGYLGTPLALGATPDAQADAHLALLDALGVASAVVVAVSAGGPSALQFAARFPGRCRALILVSTCTGRLDTPPEILRRMGSMRLLARVPGLSALLKWRARRHPEAAAARAIRDPMLCERTLRHPEAGPLLRALQLSVFDHLAARLPGTINDIGQCAALDQLPSPAITVPTLIVHGEDDNVVPFAHARAVQRLAPGSDLMAIAGGEHVALFTHLDLVRETVRAFLR